MPRWQVRQAAVGSGGAENGALERVENDQQAKQDGGGNVVARAKLGFAGGVGASRFLLRAFDRIVAVDGIVDLSAMDWHFLRRFDA